jgi:putative acetyltransferase
LRKSIILPARQADILMAGAHTWLFQNRSIDQMHLREDDLSGDEIAALLDEHLADMHSITPAESVHAMDLGALRADPNVTFWSLWEDGNLLGCGALKILDGDNGEIKSMRTAEAHRRRGVAAHILEHIIEQAQRRGLAALYLETGAMAEFAAARGLYERHGFEYCEPFADYVEDPNSVFMRLALRESFSS